VHAECLEAALSEGDALHGIWSGTNSVKRRKLRNGT
jgi:hypothetical protein